MAKKYREIRAALKDAGWEVLRHRGSHEVWAFRQAYFLAFEGKRLGAPAMSEYVIIFERDKDGGWGAYLPDNLRRGVKGRARPPDR